MTEPKKVAFSTLGPVKKEKKRDKRGKSVRLNLTLAESNEKFCPEFNYRELVSMKLHERLGKKRLGDVINGPSLDPTDPFASDEDAALKALARQMENKYGSYAPAKKKRRKENDFSTLGEGYDETDPFIDNSDAFDEVVPTHMETKHRGFYINSGELDFEEVAQESVDEDSEPSLDTEIRRKKVLRRIESDSEEDEEEEEEDSSKMDRNGYENGVIRPKKRKLDEGELLRKRKKMIGKFNAKNLEKKDSDPETEKVVNGCDSKGGDGPPNEQSIAASIEAVISKAREEAVDKKSDSQESASGSDSSSSDSDSSGSSSSSDSDSDDEEEEEEKEVDHEGDMEGDDDGDGHDLENGHHLLDSADDIPLPDDLPSDLLQVINKLKEEGHACKGSSQKFFTESVNKLLLSIVIKLNKLGGRKKTQIYNHLSQHLPCGTQTIVKRSKNLLTEKQETRLQEPLKRLKDAIDEQMPSLVEQHALECQKAAETKGENGTVYPNEEEEDDGDKKKCRLPKKKFVFTEEIQNCLCDVVRVRVQFWHLIKKRSETPEEHIRAFLDSEVRPLWPKGWMNARVLYKESYSEHAVITGATRVKTTTPVKKPVPFGGGGSSTSVVSGSISTQPPKPSLTATVIPKNFSPPAVSSPKSEVTKKKIVSSEQNTCAKISGDATLSPPALTSGGLSIKSVEKINEGAERIMQNVNVTESSNTKEKTEPSKNPSAEGSDSKIIPKEKLTPKKDDVSVIDLSSDDDRTVLNKVTSEVSLSVKSSDLKCDQTAQKEKSAVSSTTSAGAKVTSTTSEGRKEDNLEEEMNLVMNELLQISKQKSVDGYPEKQVSPKESIAISTVVSSGSKEESDKQPQVQSQTHHQLSRSGGLSLPAEKYPQKASNPLVQSDKYPPKPSSNPSLQIDKYPSKSSSNLFLQAEKYTSKPSSNPSLQTEKYSPKSSSNSSLHNEKYSLKASSSSPSLQTDKHPPKSSSNPSLQTEKYPQKSSCNPSVSTENYSQKSSISNSVQAEKFTHKSSAPSVHPEKYSQKHHSSSTYTSASHTSPVKQPRPVQHSSPVQDQQKTSHSSVDHKQHHSSSVDPLKHSVQHSSPAQHKSTLNVQSNSSLHSSTHLPKEVHQPKALQASQSHHQSLSLSKPNIQGSLNITKPSIQGSVSLPYPSQSQQHKSTTEISHRKVSSQQYSQPHLQQPIPQKTINVSVTSWNKSEASLGSKHSPESTKKSHTSWTSSSDVSVSRQKQQQQQDDIQVVSSRDPLVNLRMMHGLSVSNVNKKNSGTSSVYHNPVLATSATTYSSTSSVKISGSNSSSISNNVSSSLAHTVTSTLSSTQNQSKPSGYSTSQGKHGSSVSHASGKSSKHASNPKPRLDSYAGVNQSLFNSVTQEQLNAYKQQLQQQKQSNHLPAQELWQQMNAPTYLSGMGAISDTEMLKLVSQVGKSVDSYSQSGQYPNPGTPTSVSPHLNPYGDASRGNQHSHHISPHHLHPTHGGSEQHRGQY